MIAAYVSGLNECTFCCASHSASAAAQLDEGMSVVDQVRADLDSAPISAKLRALLRIAGAVRETDARSPPKWSPPRARRGPPIWKSTTPC